MSARKYPGSLTEDELSIRINKTESSLGPMTNMGIAEGKQTGVTFPGGPKPKSRMIVVKGNASPPKGASKICDGDIYLRNEKTGATAYRLPAD